MAKEKITCIICPIGCEIIVEGDKNEKILSSIEGNQCKRGEKYAWDEFIEPKRILTTTVKVNKGKRPIVAVRTDRPIPKAAMIGCMKILKSIEIKEDVIPEEKVVLDIFGTGANIVVTGYFL